jgi:hypothetical protein
MSIKIDFISNWQIQTATPSQLRHQSCHNVGCDKGDQIGRIFAYWVIVKFRLFLKFTEVAHIFGPLFSMAKVMYW